LRVIERYLHRRRPATTEIHVIAPNYVTVTVQAVLGATADADPAEVALLAQKALDDFLNPLNGGPDQSGWPIGRGVYRTEVMTILAGLKNVLTVSDLYLQADDGSPSCANLDVCARDLIRSGQHSIRANIAGTTIFKRSRERECS
jgi:hypothetical protein